MYLLGSILVKGLHVWGHEGELLPKAVECEDKRGMSEARSSGAPRREKQSGGRTEWREKDRVVAGSEKEGEGV